MKKKVLLIDDSEVDGISLQRYLKRSYEMKHITREEQASSVVESFKPDCILIDYHLIQKNGLEILKELIVLPHKKPVAYIMLTGQGSPTLATEAMRAGAQDFLIKDDLNQNLLLGTIARAIKTAELEYQIRFMAYHDSLTKILNREAFCLKTMGKLTKAKSGSYALAYIDLDNFKEVNDNLGHGIGDRLLQIVADRLNNLASENDLIARLGGDEFVMLIDKRNTSASLERIGQRILEAFSNTFQIGNRSLAVSASIGINSFRSSEHKFEDFLREADIALYRAKNAGGKTFRIFDEKISREIETAKNFESDLALALENEEYEVFYQPIFNSTQQIISLEALLRWKNPKRGLVSPNDFIPVLEANKQIIPVGYWVLEEVCNQCRDWLDEGISVKVNVNISPTQFQDSALEYMLKNALAHSNLPSSFLGIEITESSVVDDVENCIEVLSRIKNAGIKISLDDFGMGYSSLNYLNRFPIHCLKIDRHFVKDIEETGQTAIVEAIISMARSLRLDVVAEGVETEAQRDFLIKQGCHKFQGYLFGKPMPAAFTTDMLRAQKTSLIIDEKSA